MKTGLRPFQILGIAALLLIPSFDTVSKYTGLIGLAIYVLLGIAGVWIASRYVVPLYLSRMTSRMAVVAAIAIAVVLIVLVCVGYPLANSGRFGGGSDMDEALIIGAGAILHGTYPYYLQTYLGGYISPFPGSLILAIPFVILNAIQYQNIFWLIVLFLVARLRVSSVFAFGAVLTILFSGPTVYQVLVTGSDHMANTIFVLAPMWLLIGEFRRDSGPRMWMCAILAAFLGVALSSRSNFLLLIPLLLSVLWQLRGFGRAVWPLVIAGLTFLLVTVPFWLYDPAGFSPLTVQGSKLRDLEGTLPGAGVVLPAIALAISIALATRRMTNISRFFIYSAIVQLTALVTTSTVYSIQAGHFTLFMGTAGYGMFTLIFAAVGLWIALSEQDTALNEAPGNL